MNDNPRQQSQSAEGTPVEKFIERWTRDGQFEAEAVQHAIKRVESLPTSTNPDTD